MDMRHLGIMCEPRCSDASALAGTGIGDGFVRGRERAVSLERIGGDLATAYI